MISSATIPSSTWTRLAALAAIAVPLAAFLGWQAGGTNVPPLPEPKPIKWGLQQPQHEDTAKELAILKTRLPWGGDKSKEAEEAAAARGAHGATVRAAEKWRFAGVVERPEGSSVLVAEGPANAMKFHYLNIGDKLPDGTTLVAIAPEAATTEDTAAGGKRRELLLFRGDAAASGVVAQKAAPGQPKPAVAVPVPVPRPPATANAPPQPQRRP